MNLLPSLSMNTIVMTEPTAFMKARGMFKMIPVLGSAGSRFPTFIPDPRIILGP